MDKGGSLDCAALRHEARLSNLLANGVRGSRITFIHPEDTTGHRLTIPRKPLEGEVKAAGEKI